MKWGSWWSSPYVGTAANLAELRDCLQCAKTFEQPWLVPTGRAWPDSIVLNADVAWHWQDTHGYPVEMLADLVSTRIGFFGRVA